MLPLVSAMMENISKYLYPKPELLIKASFHLSLPPLPPIGGGEGSGKYGPLIFLIELHKPLSFSLLPLWLPLCEGER